ncbi:molybdopterin-guanine dinucleotide biosynthesis protein B [Paenibacillus doosanensis]|uniref:molybdopterin-guanine dinucleotide biosynthesis protein B n=1 Tax=Paenibacillus doosanensis TaxID=1229154 RepID=UPI00217FF0CE|nr:molybdopterin-guanine dinucleotide biosynthesis protein B [Paenibacillus doosanensis]MCS7460135.1 molybdopterin-guanine dinucleotide biosynthesis protein B [Paenibacillus doosanensis]
MKECIGFAGFSDSGKTTLVSRLIAYFQERGVRTGVIKHDAHGHYKEAEGTDSAGFIAAGAAAAAVVSPDSYIVYRREPRLLEQLVGELRSNQAEPLEIILIEGFKRAGHDQLAIFRNEEQSRILQLLAKPPIAVVAPAELEKYRIEGVPFFHPDDIAMIGKFIQERVKSGS